MPGRFTSHSVRTIAVLAITQLFGWGLSFDMVGAIGRVIGSQIGIANEIIYAGLTVMMVVSAIGGPLVGRLLAQYGARPVLASSSIGFAGGLGIVACAHDVILYMAGWIVLGVAGALGLSAPAYAAIVEREGNGAKRSIATLMLFTGLSTAIFWPVLTAMNDAFGWRMTLLLAAGAHLVLCLPLYLFVLPRPDKPVAGAASVAQAPPIHLTPSGRRRAFWLVAAATTISTFVTFGLSPSLIELLKQSGASPAFALQLASARGVLGMAARLFDMLLGRHGNPLFSALAGLAMVVASFALLAAGAGTAPMLVVFVGFYGFGSGIMAVARALLPLALFSRDEYGLQSARLSLPQNLANAASPVVFTALLDRAGLGPAIWCAALLAMLAFCLILVLTMQVRSARAVTVAV